MQVGVVSPKGTRIPGWLARVKSSAVFVSVGSVRVCRVVLDFPIQESEKGGRGFAVSTFLSIHPSVCLSVRSPVRSSVPSF